MKHSLLVAVVVLAGLGLGILFMPVLPELGGVVIIIVCGVSLFLWACRASR